MNLHITKSKMQNPLYCKILYQSQWQTSSVIVRKLGTLNQLIVEHGPTRDDVLCMGKNEVKTENIKRSADKKLSR